MGLGYLVQGACPHVASGQWLVVGEDDGVVLGVGLVAALPDPAAVVCERAVEAPVVDAERRVTARGPSSSPRVLPRGSSGTPKPWGAQPPCLQPPQPSGTGTTCAGPQAGVMLGVSRAPHPTGEQPRSPDLLVEAYIGVFRVWSTGVTERPFLHGAPLAETRVKMRPPPRGTEACPGTLAVSEDPAPRDAVTRIPAGLSLAAGGATGAAMSPPGVSSSTYGPFAISHRAQRCLPQGSGASPACSWARRPGHPTGLLPGLLGPQGRPSQTGHSRWAACLTGPRWAACPAALSGHSPPLSRPT